MFAKQIGWVMTAAVLAAGAGVSSVLAGDEDVVLYKNPDCGCCGKWAEHLREAGFSVREVSSPRQMNVVRDEAGMPRELASCHTARVDGYLVEGHVPAADVRRLLAERPDVAGIAVPGMPLGSPGMEGPYEPDAYEVLTFGGRVGTQVFSRH